MAEVYRLDEVRIRFIYFHPLNPKSIGEPYERIKIRPKGKGVSLSDKQVWLAHGRSRNWPDWYSLEQYKKSKKAKEAKKPEEQRKQKDDTLALLEEKRRLEKKITRRIRRELKRGQEP